jgi:hypothetical protein
MLGVANGNSSLLDFPLEHFSLDGRRRADGGRRNTEADVDPVDASSVGVNVLQFLRTSLRTARSSDCCMLYLDSGVGVLSTVLDKDSIAKIGIPRDRDRCMYLTNTIQPFRGGPWWQYVDSCTSMVTRNILATAQVQISLGKCISPDYRLWGVRAAPRVLNKIAHQTGP